ncbi:unnamed protein product [Oikopleura dioica]|uniref:Uncharacterized protein n=1 Tax=Oikopleura dioica TaxID=34765 RepID=E4XZN4_OIKDI|nr:unnamed protein product [Oikopleura dioica]
MQFSDPNSKNLENLEPRFYDIENLNKTTGRVFTNFDPVNGSETLFRSHRHEVFILKKPEIWNRINETFVFSRQFARNDSITYLGYARICVSDWKETTISLDDQQKINKWNQTYSIQRPNTNSSFIYRLFRRADHECLESNFFDPRTFDDLKLVQEIYNKVDFWSLKLHTFAEKLVFDMEVINDTHLFSKAHQISNNFSFLNDPLKMKELKMVLELKEDYNTLLLGKTKMFGSNFDYTVALGDR